MLTGRLPSSGPASELLLHLAVGLGLSLPYFCTEKLAGPWGPGGLYSWMCPAAFSHRPVLPTRHELQRLTCEGNKNKFRERKCAFSRSQVWGEGSRRCTCICVGGLTSTVWEPHLRTRGSSETGMGAGSQGYPKPYYPRIFRMPTPATFSSPNNQMAPCTFPSPQTPSQLF